MAKGITELTDMGHVVKRPARRSRGEISALTKLVGDYIASSAHWSPCRVYLWLSRGDIECGGRE